MAENLEAKTAVTVNAPVTKVWQALTDPALIKQYLFGTETVTDWKTGSPITWSGEYEGKTYRDKGTIVEFVPEKLLHVTHYTPMTGKGDKPENYHNVIYELTPDGTSTTISIRQDNIGSEKELAHMEKNWTSVLEGMKRLLEHA